MNIQQDVKEHGIACFLWSAIEVSFFPPSFNWVFNHVRNGRTCPRNMFWRNLRISCNIIASVPLFEFTVVKSEFVEQILIFWHIDGNHQNWRGSHVAMFSVYVWRKFSFIWLQVNVEIGLLWAFWWFSSSHMQGKWNDQNVQPKAVNRQRKLASADPLPFVSADRMEKAKKH